MRLRQATNFDKNQQNPKNWADVSNIVKKIINLINGEIKFQDNIKCNIVDVDFQVADADTPIDHNLGFIPVGYLVIQPTVSMNIYNGSQSWSNGSIYLRSTVVGAARIIVF